MAMITAVDPGYINRITIGDSCTLAAAIPDESVDLIFTDPPYTRDAMWLYGWLAGEAERVLKPGGFLLTYVGMMMKHEAMMQLGGPLTYFWDYVALDTGAGSVVWIRKTLSRCKSILAYTKGAGVPRCRVLGVWNGGGKDKRFHRWGQDESTARYYIDCFSFPGSLVWEPFVGGGTVPWVCTQLERDFIGFEIDPVAAARAKERLAVMQRPLPGMRVCQLELQSVESE
jgi:DNA methylase